MQRLKDALLHFRFLLGSVTRKVESSHREAEIILNAEFVLKQTSLGKKSAA